jgi:hypothetical protein
VPATDTPAGPAGTPLWMRLYGGVISVFTWIFYILRAVFTLLGMGFKALRGVLVRRGAPPPAPPPSTPPGPPPPMGGVTPLPPYPPPAPAALAPVSAVGGFAAPSAPPAAVHAAAATVPTGPVVVAAPPVHLHVPDEDDADHSGEESDELSLSPGEDAGGQGPGPKRRGIRLKQHLD